MRRWLVRPAAVGDANVLAALEVKAFGPASWGAGNVKAGLAAPLVSALLAFRDGGLEAEAFALWRTLGDEGEILSIGVKSDTRRRGAGDALVEAILSDASADSLVAMFLEVDARNAAAIGLYEKHGFERIGVRRRYYRDGADAWVLRKSL